MTRRTEAWTGLAAKRLRVVFVVLTLGLLSTWLAGCGRPGPTVDTATGVNDLQTLDCTRLGYPCTAAEVTPEVEREGIRVARAALRRLFEEPGLAALEWIRAQPGVVHAVGNDHVIRFRLAGGRPVWVLGEHRLEPLVPGVESAESSAMEFWGPESLTVTPDAARPPPQPGPRRDFWLPSFSLFSTLHAQPVGDDRDQDGHVTDRDFRRALVLDPFRWQWTQHGTRHEYREGTTLVGMLKETRGFRDGVVTYRPDEEANESQFRGWDSYDLVHYSGHSERICEEDGPCYTAIFTGDTRPIDQLDDPADTARETGVMEYTDPATGARIEQRHVGLSSDWFNRNYSNTLDRTIVFVNGCGSVDPVGHGFVPDYLAPIVASGDGTTIVGWDDYVPTLAAQAAALDFYEKLIATGLRAGDVFDRMSTGIKAALNSDERTARLRVGSGQGAGVARAKARIREVVALHVPGGARLTDGPQPQEVLQGNADDGRDDTLSVDLIVHGVLPDEEHRWSLDLLLDDRPIQRDVRLSGQDKIGDYAYRVPLRNVSLERDLQPDSSETLMAVARLPEGGESRTKIDITVVKEYARMGSGSGPSGAEIDQALPIELDKFHGYVYPYGYRKAGNRYVGAVDGVEGLVEPCVIRFPLLSSTTTGDAMAFAMNRSGPLAPGTYNIADGKVHKAPDEVTGAFLASFRIGAGNALSGGRNTEYGMNSGTVTIHSVSGGLVRGELRGNGVAGPTGLGEKPPNYPQLSVGAEFSILVTAPMGEPFSNQPYACLNEESPDGDPVPTTPQSQETEPGIPIDGVPRPSDPEPPQVTEDGISIQATGPAASGEWNFGDKDFSLAGGCTGSSQMNFGFASGAPHLDDWVYLSFTTEQAVESGETGTFNLASLTWDQGVERPANLPPESPIRVPRRYEGKGILRLDRHDNYPNQRRLSGSIEGELVRRSPLETVTLSAEFSIPMSCGVNLSPPRD